MDKTGKYVDGFVVPLPKKNIDAYKAFSEKAGKVWKKHGALEYVECIADDVKSGKVTSFPQAVKLEEGEVDLLLARGARPDQRRRHERPGTENGSEVDALRRHADVLRRL
jgi:uncharacterized protein YbaA (DUF1428 family)